MAVVGYQTTPTTNSNFGTFAGQQVATSFTMPSPGGLLTDLHVYCATDSGSSNAGFLCLWDSVGNLLTSVAVTIPAAEAFVAGTLGTSWFIPGGTVFFIGAQINSSGTTGLKWHYDSHSGSNIDGAHNATIPGALANIVQVTASAGGAWATYTPSEVFVNSGTPASPVWTSGPLFINTGTPAAPVWTAVELFVNTGTPASPVWTPAL